MEPILRAADILRAFGADGAVLRVRDVVDRTGLHKATVSRLLQSLAAAGLVERVKPVGFRSLTSLTPRRKLRVGYASQNERAEFPAQITAHLWRAAELYDVELMVFDNRFNREVALRNIDAMVRKRVDVAIVFTTIEAIARTISERLRSAGIPLIAVEMPLPGAPYYGANNYGAGWTAGQALGRWARRQWKSRVERVVLIELPEAGPLPEMRMTGALEGIRDVIPGIRDSQVVRLDGRNDFAHSRRAVREWLSTAPAGNCLVAAINDPGALGAIAAFRQAKHEGEYAVAGQNATLAARLEMRRPGSPLIGSVAYHPERYGAELTRMAIHLAQHRLVPDAVYAQHCFVGPRNVDRLFPGDRAIR
ncbi:MAG: substrate-binding domain-containing protein [Acidobacteria bacterium]|nr:substrate-binding domain-containing protein [Acidobacteriota bacterium]